MHCEIDLWCLKYNLHYIATYIHMYIGWTDQDNLPAVQMVLRSSVFSQMATG